MKNFILILLSITISIFTQEKETSQRNQKLVSIGEFQSYKTNSNPRIKDKIKSSLESQFQSYGYETKNLSGDLNSKLNQSKQNNSNYFVDGYYQESDTGVRLYGQVYDPETGVVIDAFSQGLEFSSIDGVNLDKEEMKTNEDKEIEKFTKKLSTIVRVNPKKNIRNENIDEHIAGNQIGKDIKFPVKKEDASAAANEVFKLLQSENQEVVTATRSKISVRDAPATIYVVTSKQIRERGYRTLFEALKDLPGFNAVHAYGVWPHLIQQRGLTTFSNQKTLVYIDGIPVNILSENSALGGTIEYPLFNVDRIEVVAGPASALYGANAFNGIINVITKDGKSSPGNQVQAMYGSFESNGRNPGYSGAFASRGFVDISKTEHAQYSVGGYYYQTEGPYFGGVQRQDKQQIDSTAPNYANPNDARYFVEQKACGGECRPGANSVGQWWSKRYSNSSTDTYNITGKLSFKNFRFEVINWQYLQGSGTFFSGTQRLDYTDRGLETDNFDFRNNARRVGIFQRRINSAGASGPHWDMKGTSIATGYSHNFTDKLSLDSEVISRSTEILNSSRDNNYSRTGVYGEYNYNLYNTANPTGSTTNVNGVTSLTGQGTTNVNPTNLTLNQRARPDYGYEFRERLSYSPNEKHSLTVGIEGIHTVVPRGYNSDQRFTFNNYGAYIQHQWKLTEWFSLTLGGRHDVNTNFGSTNNPRISGVFKLTKDLTLKLLAGTGFSAPSGWEMFSQTSTRKGNENLRPERLKSYEMGLGYRFLQKYYVSGNVNYNTISGLLLEVQTQEQIPGTGTNATNPARFWTQNQNAVDARILGSELTTEIQVLKNLSINGNYSYNRGLFVKPSPFLTSSPSTEGRPGDDLALDIRNAILRRRDVPGEGAIPNYPTHKVNLGTTFYFTENVSLYTGANYVDIRRTVSTNWANKVVPPYIFVRMNLHWENFLFQGMFLDFLVNNVLNKQFYDAGVRTGNNPYPSMHPLEGRNMWLTVGYRF